jgi:hypothetical protein
MKDFKTILEESAYQQAVAEAAITPKRKFDRLLRLGLVSSQNLAKARRIFKNPEKFGETSNFELRQLVMDILQDLIDNVVDDPRVYNMILSAYIKNNDKEDMEESVDEYAKFTQLAKAGLVNRSVLSKTLRVVKNPTKVNPLEYKTIVMTLLMDLLDRVTGDPTVYNALRRSVAQEEVANTASAPGLAMVSDGEPVLVKKKRKKNAKDQSR